MTWTCGKCGHSVALNSEQEVLFCPECGQEVTSSEPSSSSIPLEGDSGNIGTPECGVLSTCPICCCEVFPDDEIETCPDCKVVYHKDCWEENKGCATYGCTSSHSVDAHLKEAENTLVPCPWCHMLIPGNEIVCSVCGKRTDLYTEQSQINQRAVAVFEILKRNLLLLWNDLVLHLKRLGPYLMEALALYKRCILKYIVFEGKDTRREFAGFVIVSLPISLILVMIPDNLILAYIYWAGTILPTVGAMIRRLRDTGLTPWFLLAGPLLPLLLFVPSVENATEQQQ